ASAAQAGPVLPPTPVSAPPQRPSASTATVTSAAPVAPDASSIARERHVSVPGRPASDAGVASREDCALVLRSNLPDTSAQVDRRASPLNTPVRLACGRHSGVFKNTTLNERVPFSVDLTPARARTVV